MLWSGKKTGMFLELFQHLQYAKNGSGKPYTHETPISDPHGHWNVVGQVEVRNKASTTVQYK